MKKPMPMSSVDIQAQTWPDSKRKNEKIQVLLKADQSFLYRTRVWLLENLTIIVIICVEAKMGLHITTRDGH